ncbi:MAG: T9SS type A sorting domain-containing protein [candidate division Zixibacteria bacterium]|nr:T9SS type A sorting domain-containing protein [candidate division Zixibacteria bacterium]
MTIPKPAGITVTRALAYDPETNHFWTANFSSNIVEFDRSGTVINSLTNTKSAYGMTWDNVSADGPWLWVHSQNGTPNNGMQVSQFNPVTGVYTGVEFQAEEVNGPSPNGDIAGGAAFFVDDFTAPLGAILLLGQGGGIGYDYLSCFEITEAGGEPPCCDVDMTPDDDPVIVEPGGRFGLTGYIGNPTPDPITTDVWGGVIYSGNFFQQFAFNNIPLNPGQFLTAHTWQNVPGFAPQGTYTYRAYCGDRPSVKCDSAEFPFTVVAGRDGNATEWSIEGEFFGNYVPTEYTLVGAYPNPFNVTTTITFEIPVAGVVNLEVYNLMGQKVATLYSGHADAGRHSVIWNAADQASGVYFYKLSAGEKVFTQRVTLLK